MGRDIEAKVLCICPMGSKRRDMEVKIFYIRPIDSERWEVEIKIFCICPVRYIILYNDKRVKRYHRCIQIYAHQEMEVSIKDRKIYYRPSENKSAVTLWLE